jgi:hypothetical protein
MEQANIYCAILAIGVFVWFILSRPKRDHVLVKRNWSKNSVSEAVSEGYNSVRHSLEICMRGIWSIIHRADDELQITEASGNPFFVRYWSHDYLVLSSKYLPDVRRAQKDHLSFVDSISDVFFMYNWIGDLFKSTRMQTLVMKGINPRLRQCQIHIAR